MLINDLLASGEIPGLFADDEVENIISGVRNEVKGAGLQDTRENCWMFFIERVRRNLKVKVNGIFVRIKQFSEGHTNVSEHFPKITKDLRGCSEDVVIIRQQL